MLVYWSWNRPHIVVDVVNAFGSDLSSWVGIGCMVLFFPPNLYIIFCPLFIMIIPFFHVHISSFHSHVNRHHLKEREKEKLMCIEHYQILDICSCSVNVLSHTVFSSNCCHVRILLFCSKFQIKIIAFLLSMLLCFKPGNRVTIARQQ